jgi:hypothetical protein
MSVLCWHLPRQASYLVLIVGVEVHACLLGLLPHIGYALVDVGLVDDLWDQLRAVVDGARVWRREFAAEDGIFATGSDEQTQQSPDAVYREAEYNNGDEDEYGDASAHGDGFALWPPFLGASLVGRGRGESARVVCASHKTVCLLYRTSAQC